MVEDWGVEGLEVVVGCKVVAVVPVAMGGTLAEDLAVQQPVAHMVAVVVPAARSGIVVAGFPAQVAAGPGVGAPAADPAVSAPAECHWIGRLASCSLLRSRRAWQSNPGSNYISSFYILLLFDRFLESLIQFLKRWRIPLRTK